MPGRVGQGMIRVENLVEGTLRKFDRPGLYGTASQGDGLERNRLAAVSGRIRIGDIF